MITYFIFGISYSLACVVQPGPFQAFLLSQSLTKGWRKTIPLVFAPLLSDIPVIVLVLFVLAHIPDKALHILQCIGGVFLLYLAYNAWQTLQNINKIDKHNAPNRQSFFKAVFVNLLNPAPYIGWSLVLGPQLIKGWTDNPVYGIILLTGFYGSMIIYSVIMVMFFAAAGNFGKGFKSRIIGVSVVILVVFAFYQLWLGSEIFL
jgi:threonine/homoserine/homoserine lactone efflux protein